MLGLIFEKINGYKDGSFFTPVSYTHLDVYKRQSYDNRLSGYIDTTIQLVEDFEIQSEAKKFLPILFSLKA